jgi:hypothetical protein
MQKFQDPSVTKLRLAKDMICRLQDQLHAAMEPTQVSGCGLAKPSWVNQCMQLPCNISCVANALLCRCWDLKAHI